MREVAIVGAGMIRFGKYPQASYADLAQPAISDALAMADIERGEIDVIFCGSSFGGMLTGQRIVKGLGLSGPPIINVENACSSGASAFAQAYATVAAGLHETALVIGVDKLTQFAGGTLPLNLEDVEVAGGLTMPALYAMRAQRYLHDHDLDLSILGEVCVKSRLHGARNPYAQLRHPVSVEEVLGSRTIASPLTLYQCCPTGDGAAALVITSLERASRRIKQPVKVMASVTNSGRYRSGFRDMTSPEITVRSAAELYERAGVGPEDVDMAEVHDAFSIAELLYYEALGFCGPGDSVGLLRSGATSVGGRLPVNPSGGLLSKGHPIGASGVAQLVEIVWQLLGLCGERQVDGARIGIAHVTGGGISGFDHGACSIHMLGR
jgi:benzoylsuccinyl-CoA thiolase BbsB subunit